eukprot:TRINITY_DN4322_c0_g1_i1.p1 TRINITY_DN4322_c0_g1~~TRINITY_DN4322_c0_g1_i1.p1  ORF type:complete len:466 (-),score=137.52 TRINITY_DN4322_c0_g1_i1:54-1451(-)
MSLRGFKPKVVWFLVLVSVFVLAFQVERTNGSLHKRFPFSDSGFCGAHTFTYEPDRTAANPLRGFVPDLDAATSEQSFPHSMKFKTFDLKTLIDHEDFPWEELQSSLSALPSDLQLIIRFDLDCSRCSASGSSIGREVEDFLGEFAKRYDGDVRIGFVIFGDFSLPSPEDSASMDDTEEAFVRAMRFFKKTRVSLSSSLLPSRARELREEKVSGIFDPNFSDHTYSAQQQNPNAGLFYNLLIRTRLNTRWQLAPVGGIAARKIEGKIFNENWKGDNLDIDAQRTHVSWIKDNSIFRTTSSRKKKIASRINFSLGYQFFIKRICLRKCLDAPEDSNENCVRISVLVQNRGIAPFYYPLKMVAETHDGKKHVFDFDLQRLLPAARTYTMTQKITWGKEKIDQDQKYADIRKIKIYLESDAVRKNILLANRGGNPKGQMKLLIPMRCLHVSRIERDLIRRGDDDERRD